VNITISAKESLGYYELKKHKPLFGRSFSKLLDEKKANQIAPNCSGYKYQVK
jgi:hypothetical protein